jgi:hypothetical protein
MLRRIDGGLGLQRPAVANIETERNTATTHLDTGGIPFLSRTICSGVSAVTSADSKSGETAPQHCLS